MQTLDVAGNIYCSEELIRSVENQVIYFSLISILLGTTVIVGNTLKKQTNKQTKTVGVPWV